MHIGIERGVAVYTFWYVAKEQKKNKHKDGPLIEGLPCLPLVVLEKSQTLTGHVTTSGDLPAQQAAVRKAMEEAHFFERIAILVMFT